MPHSDSTEDVYCLGNALWSPEANAPLGFFGAFGDEAATGLDTFATAFSAAAGSMVLSKNLRYFRNIAVHRGVLNEIRLFDADTVPFGNVVAYLTGVGDMPMISGMGIRGASAVANRAAELNGLLRTAWPAVVVEPSALKVLPRINLNALRAVVEAARGIKGAPCVSRVKGFVSHEDPDWAQLLLVITNPGEPGTDPWRQTLEAAGAVIEAAIDRHPELSDDIASQISFDL